MGRLDFDAMCTVRFDWNGHVSKGRVAMAGFSFAYIKKMDNQNKLGGRGNWKLLGCKCGWSSKWMWTVGVEWEMWRKGMRRFS